MKHSRKREAILRVIRAARVHPGARWVYERLKPEIPDLSLGTVYRNINLFKEAGDVAFLGVFHGEERFDGRVEPHLHAICRRCGKIADLPDVLQAELLAGLSARAEQIPDFSLDMRNTVFYGLCTACIEETTA